MDALSDVLRVVRLSAGVFLDAEFTAPWSVSSQVGPEDCYPGGDVPERLIAFHYVVAGHMAIEPEGREPLELRPGAVVLLPRKVPHVIASDAGRFAVVNWHPLPREETPVLDKPRGPATAVRMSQEAVRTVVRAGGVRAGAAGAVTSLPLRRDIRPDRHGFRAVGNAGP